ncbi:MAG: LysM peptidoglycan-binding domain-containing protein [Ignavibacteriae bacterium]|nr:MAG: LysM peptidoglycan-binding domain-containing protein [Ignavibacteriota bacterium]
MDNMKTINYFFTLLVLGFVLLAMEPQYLICRQMPDSTRLIPVSILYTANNNGYLENCECPGNPLGGLDRRVKLMQQLQMNSSTICLLLDGGDFLSSVGFPEKDDFVLEAYGNMRYDVLALGDQEFANGYSYVVGNLLKRSLPLVSASIEIKGVPNTAIKKYVIKDIQGIRFGITSVISDEPFELMPKDKIQDLKIADVRSCLNNVLKELRQKSDIVILLSHLGYSKDSKCAKESDAPDIIIGAHSQTLLQEPEHQGSSILVHSGKNGEHLGQLDILVDKTTKRIVKYSGQPIPILKDMEIDTAMKSLINRYKTFASTGYKDHTLVAGMNDSPDKTGEYIVKKGDTLWRIAIKIMGDPFQWKQLFEMNKDLIKNAQLIYPDQKIRIRKNSGQNNI